MKYPIDLARTQLNPRIQPPNRAAVSFPAGEIKGSIVQRFEKIAARRPEGIAVKFEAQVLTYEALNGWANRIARAVVERRDAHSEPIALLFGPVVNAIAAILGMQKAGKFFFAIDPQFPAERARFLSSDTQAPLILTDSRHFELARSLN